jgi:hypothetical protein
MAVFKNLRYLATIGEIMCLKSSFGYKVFNTLPLLSNTTEMMGNLYVLNAIFDNSISFSVRDELVIKALNLN